MRMLGSDVDFELLDYFTTKFIVRQHAPNSATQNPLGVLGKLLAQGYRLDKLYLPSYCQ
jgi:hypothetical protein